MKSASFVCFASALALFSSDSQAVAETGWRTVTDMGCHTVDYTCFVTLSGASFGPAGCTGNQMRWDSQTMPNAKNFLAQMTAAFLAGRQVNVAIGDSCYSAWPTPNYYHVASF